MKKKICKKYGWILIWGLVSIVFAAVLQFLFSLEAPIPFLQAKWSAGDILTYSSTILLGLLALWQNQRFKNENDATQEKLEALSTRANELQITSKLIEHEAERINLLRTQFQTFFDACACNYLVADYKDTAKGEKRYAYYSTLRSSQIRTSYQVLWQQLNMDKFAEDLDAAEEVCVYAKLPRTFQIPTPVGNYSPDWAIAFYAGTVKHIFFVAETKGTMKTLELRPIEQAKISCAKKLFNEMSTSHVVYHDVDSYQSLLNIMNSI